MSESSSTLRILGITAPVQMAKVQLRGTFEDCGWEFCDLNDLQCELREKGTERYELFNRSFPGCLKDDGGKTGRFYASVTREFYVARLEEDIPILAYMIRDKCLSAAGKLVLSWEYLPFIASSLPLDHTLHFVSDHGVWFERIRSRAKEIGMVGELGDSDIERIIDLLNLQPETVLHQVQSAMAGKFTTLDVSDDDWGSAVVKKWLSEHGG